VKIWAEELARDRALAGLRSKDIPIVKNIFLNFLI
jgi:hypothetical protein